MNARDYFALKTVVITGGSSGIGLSLAEQLAGLSARVVLVARRPALLEEARAKILARHASASVKTVPLDISDEEATQRAMSDLADSEPIDVLVNNAGVVLPGRFLDLPMKEFRQMMDVNYFGMVHMCKAVLPRMTARSTGHVVNVSSLAGVMGIYGYTAYAASKFAVVGFSQALRGEMWPHGVRVSVCLPPDTDTPQLAFENQHKPAETKAIAGTVKTLSPEAVATAMVQGMARGQFEIYPDLASRMVALGQGVLPSVARWVCDAAQRKAAPEAARG
jgi:3-dehydrosphinganine reductase